MQAATFKKEGALYELHAYALDFVPALETGFYMNELFHAIRGHVLAEALVSGLYSN